MLSEKNKKEHEKFTKTSSSLSEANQVIVQPNYDESLVVLEFSEEINFPEEVLISSHYWHKCGRMHGSIFTKLWYHWIFYPDGIL